MRDTKNLKPEKKQHDHTFTDCLKAAIFSLVMLAPIFSIAVRCGYVMFNKNAYESYYGETINEKTYTPISNLRTDLKIGETYYIDKNSFTNTYQANVGSYSNGFIVSNVVILYCSMDLSNFDTTNIEKVSPYYNNAYQGNKLEIALYNGIESKVISSTNEILLTFVYEGNNLNNDWQDGDFVFDVEYNNYSYLDNAFTYGISNLKNENVFNWTQNTAIYTPIHAMTTGLGITEDAIAIMLTYWILMIAIYIIVDMIIWIFTKLTHILQ